MLSQLQFSSFQFHLLHKNSKTTKNIFLEKRTNKFALVMATYSLTNGEDGPTLDGETIFIIQTSTLSIARENENIKKPRQTSSRRHPHLALTGRNYAEKL